MTRARNTNDTHWFNFIKICTRPLRILKMRFWKMEFGVWRTNLANGTQILMLYFDAPWVTKCWWNWMAFSFQMLCTVCLFAWHTKLGEIEPSWSYTFMSVLNPVLFVFRGCRRTKSISSKVFVLCVSQTFWSCQQTRMKSYFRQSTSNLGLMTILDGHAE